MSNLFCVIVTYGNTISNAPYAAGVDRDEAEKLKEHAIGLGYRDARVITSNEFKEIRAAAQRKWSDSRRTETVGR